MQTFEASVTDLEKALKRLEERVAALERAERVTVAAPLQLAEPVASPLIEGDDRESQIALVGKTVLVLGGAYLLRAITDLAIVPRPVGVALGLAYAVAWFVLANRSAREGASLAATMHALAGALIAYPLLFEATHRFHVLPAGVGIVLLAAVTATGFAIAWRRALRPMAWIVTIAALIGGLLMLLSTEAFLPYGIFFIALGVATVWASYVLDWFALRWIPAAAANLLVLALTILAGQGKGGVDPDQVIGLQLLLFAAYLGTFAVRTLLRGRDALPFEIAQTTAALAIGAGGAGFLSASSPSIHLALGAALLVLALGSYAVAFAFVDRAGGSVRNFFFYSSVALVLLFYGSALMVKGPALTLAWGAIGVLAAFLADRFTKVTLAAHAAAYLLAATIVSGAFGSAVMALAFPLGSKWLPMGVAAWIVVALLASSVWLLGARSAEFQERAETPRLVLFSLFVLGAAGIVLHAAIASGLAAAPSSLAAVRTGVLSAAAVLLAAAAHHRRLALARFLVYPVLVLAAIKLTIEDLRLGTPLTLFISFALYGGALIIAPRLRKRGKWAPRALGAQSQQSRT
jgi:hypothetical protein